MPVDVKTELQICKQQESDRLPMDSWWQTIKEMTVPRDAYITRQSSPTPIQHYDRIYDTTVIESAEGLANMMTAQLTPAGEYWAVWAPPFEFDVTNFIKKGKNELEIKVTNTWRNQLIFDNKRPKDAKKTWKI